ncbi:alcohol dehydrogenase [Alloscardovia venturai]|uniref:Alcohol dehydrogenase n=1 Tax=Alloscardovia venturai TaxID=1769421 RepID=A0ABW2Y4U0_9BIFI
MKNSRLQRWVVTLVTAVIVAVAGMFTYRLGAAYSIPYGLFLTLFVVGVSCFLAGLRGGLWHEFVHAVISTVIVWMMAFSSTSSSTVIALGGAALTNFWSFHASAIWLYGIIVVQIVVSLFPHTWLKFFQE